MPTYEYVCESCGHECEVTQKFNDPAPTCRCDHCGEDLASSIGVPMVRQISLSSFVLKGGGWAKQGYSKKGKK